jgi:3-hydroxyacyl-CoA dehydrogenase
LDAAKSVDDLKERIKILFSGKDKAGEFYRSSFLSLFSYISNRIPEISDELYRIDEAMKAGFGWEVGAYETWDALGVQEVVSMMETAGKKPAAWV